MKEILLILDKMYGSVADGDDLLAEFYQLHQATNQTASEYLNGLFIHLSEVITKGALQMSDLPKLCSNSSFRDCMMKISSIS